ncbi:peptidylprolyl isomerase [Sulfuricaulis limicola]|nr:peptidylprolyl isomerase [Sulfuricaulis limicola]
MKVSRAVPCIASFCRRYFHGRMYLRAMACAVLASVLSPPLLAANTIVRIETNVGGFNVELYDTDTPLTVGNFLGYVNRNDYDNSVIHRHATLEKDGLAVIQGGVTENRVREEFSLIYLINVIHPGFLLCAWSAG